MKYLIFGAGGFLGSTLVKHLKEKGETVYPVKRSAKDAAYAVDITSPEQFGVVDVQPDIVINCASALPDSEKAFSDPIYLRQLYETNVIGAANIMNWAASRNIKKVINCSTLVVVGKPWPVPLKEGDNTYPLGAHVGYSASKLSQELVMSSIADAHHIDLLHLRISALYGPHMKAGGILTKLISQAAAKEAISLTNGNNVTFDFLQVDDAASIIYHLSKAGFWPERVINLASGEEVSLLALAETIYELSGSPKGLIANVDNDYFSSRAQVDTSLLEKHIAGTGISTKPFAEKVKGMISVK